MGEQQGGKKMTLQFRSYVLALLGLTLFIPSAFAQESPPAGTPAAAGQPLPADSAPPAAIPEPSPPPAPASVAIAPAASPLKIDDPSGNTIRFGLLLQPQYQAASSPTLNSYSHNLYIRRTRLLVGGKLLGKLEFFFDTDYPNLFLDSTNTAAAGAPEVFEKTGPGMMIQDAFVTYKVLDGSMEDYLKVDAGFMLPPMSHNAVQGATTLFGWDYFTYAFRHSNSFGSTVAPVGRDAGVQLRGLLVDGHLEYRLGLFQGLRDNVSATDVQARNFFRATGRVQVNLLDAETGFFYAGTYLGAKRIASVGGSFDIQGAYKYFAVDGIVDMPLGPGVVTGQLNLAHWNGGTLIPGLPKQTALMGEAGYSFAGYQVSPIIRYEHLWGSGALPNQAIYSGGLAYWPYGHNMNLKAFFSHVKTDGAARGANQFNLQWQVYFF
jgi:hypothetical protein